MCIQPKMRVEETAPNKPKFILVVYLFAGTVVVIVLAFIIVISWRNRKGHKTPYTKTPTSWLAAPPAGPEPLQGSASRLWLEHDAA